MSIKEIKKMQSEKGFTIVELLIVIVVIGILAAIVIVAFNGITTNARNTQYKSEAANIQKLAETYNAEVGSYPLTNANFAATANYSGRLPANVVIAPTTGTVTNDVTTSSGATAPTLGTQTWARHEYTNASNVTTTYISIKTNGGCSSTAGINVYYPQVGGSLGVAKAGAGC